MQDCVQYLHLLFKRFYRVLMNIVHVATFSFPFIVELNTRYWTYCMLWVYLFSGLW